jgi:hypothetical protein
MTGFLQDLRFAARQVRKNPGFTAVAVITLALGMGANTAILGLVESAFLRGLPFRAPERLIHVWTIEADGDTHTPTPAQYVAVREDGRSFEQVAAAGWGDFLFDAGGTISQNLSGVLVTPNWLPTLGIQPLLVEVPTPKAPPIEQQIFFVSVSPEYFSALRIPMLSGRPFRETDSQGGSPVAIVNQTFAKQYFPGKNPIGYHLALGDSPQTERQIVGVVSDFRQRNPEEDLRPLAYFPVAQTAPAEWSLAIRIRAASDTGSLAARVGNWLRPVDPELYWELSSMQAEIEGSESLTLRRPMITLVACFGTLALALVIVGVFGVTSYSVAERTREIGIRVALGAVRGAVAGLVLRELLAVASLGLAVGTLCALAVTRLFPTQGIGWSGSGIFLYGVSRTDSRTYLVAAAILTGVVLAAGWLPARRAMKVDPMDALRYE